MINQSSFTEAQQKAIAKVQKLMALAAGNANEHEAALATERAQAILADLNLSMDDLSAADAQKGGRSEERLVGGFYQHERDMWKAIAELNFCFYWTVKVHYDEETAKRERRKYAHHHRLIGRTVNILASKIMADYLLQTVERLTREYCELERPWETYHPRSSTAVSFRKGAAERLIEMINHRRWEILQAERRKAEEQARTAAHPGAAPSANALVVTGLLKSEHEANYDFMHGEGAYAKVLARRARWEEEDRKLEEAHQLRLQTDEAYRKEHEKRMRDEARKARNRKGRAYREPRFKGDHAAFGAGYDRASSVSLDKQVDKEARKALR